MRTREEIEKTLDVVIGTQGSSTYFKDTRPDVIIELLLDIRELLQQQQDATDVNRMLGL